MSEPGLSVVVSTRNRPDDIGPCIASILANPGDHFEIVVVDQSINDATAIALGPSMSDKRLVYLRSETRGLSISRNIALERVRAPTIAFVDDDCRTPPDWVATLLSVFESIPDAAMIFGRVEAPESPFGHAAEFEPSCREIQHRLPTVDSAWGIGANMAFRREVFQKVGTFDPYLGAGAKFPAGEETDLMIRALAAGFKIVNAKEVSVVHLGTRHGAAASTLMRGYGLGLGAALIKHARLGTRDAKRLVAMWILHNGKRGLENAVRGRNPTGLGFVGAFLLGAIRSHEHGIDPHSSVYGASRVRERDKFAFALSGLRPRRSERPIANG